MSTTSPLVSICLPVRNGEETIGETAASVLGQTYENLELVIFDNDSTDGTEKVCRELARQDSRVRYHRNPENIGLLANVVAATRGARGAYFRVIGDDDLLEPDCIASCMEVFQADPRLVLVTTRVAYVVGDAVYSPEYSGAGLDSDDPATRAIEMLRLLALGYRQLDPLYGLIRRDLADLPRRNMLREDEIFAVRLALAGPWGHVPRVLARNPIPAGPSNLPAILGVPRWQARFADMMQVRELLHFVDETPLTSEQRARIRAAIYRMYLRRHTNTFVRRSRKLARLAVGLGR